MKDAIEGSDESNKQKYMPQLCLWLTLLAWVSYSQQRGANPLSWRLTQSDYHTSNTLNPPPPPLPIWYQKQGKKGKIVKKNLNILRLDDLWQAKKASLWASVAGPDPDP